MDDNTKSRYHDLDHYLVPGPDGRPVTVAVSPRRDRPSTTGHHRRRDGERLDHLAAHYLADPNGYWRICDANGALLADSLTDQRRIDIPGERP